MDETSGNNSPPWDPDAPWDPDTPCEEPVHGVTEVGGGWEDWEEEAIELRISVDPGGGDDQGATPGAQEPSSSPSEAWSPPPPPFPPPAFGPVPVVVVPSVSTDAGRLMRPAPLCIQGPPAAPTAGGHAGAQVLPICPAGPLAPTILRMWSSDSLQARADFLGAHGVYRQEPLPGEPTADWEGAPPFGLGPLPLVVQTTGSDTRSVSVVPLSKVSHQISTAEVTNLPTDIPTFLEFGGDTETSEAAIALASSWSTLVQEAWAASTCIQVTLDTPRTPEEAADLLSSGIHWPDVDDCEWFVVCKPEHHTGSGSEAPTCIMMALADLQHREEMAPGSGAVAAGLELVGLDAIPAPLVWTRGGVDHRRFAGAWFAALEIMRDRGACQCLQSCCLSNVPFMADMPRAIGVISLTRRAKEAPSPIFLRQHLRPQPALHPEETRLPTAGPADMRWPSVYMSPSAPSATGSPGAWDRFGDDESGGPAGASPPQTFAVFTLDCGRPSMAQALARGIAGIPAVTSATPLSDLVAAQACFLAARRAQAEKEPYPPFQGQQRPFGTIATAPITCARMADMGFGCGPSFSSVLWTHPRADDWLQGTLHRREEGAGAAAASAVVSWLSRGRGRGPPAPALVSCLGWAGHMGEVADEVAARLVNSPGTLVIDATGMQDPGNLPPHIWVMLCALGARRGPILSAASVATLRRLALWWARTQVVTTSEEGRAGSGAGAGAGAGTAPLPPLPHRAMGTLCNLLAYAMVQHAIDAKRNIGLDKVGDGTWHLTLEQMTAGVLKGEGALKAQHHHVTQACSTILGFLGQQRSRVSDSAKSVTELLRRILSTPEGVLSLPAMKTLLHRLQTQTLSRCLVLQCMPQEPEWHYIPQCGEYHTIRKASLSSFVTWGQARLPNWFAGCSLSTMGAVLLRPWASLALVVVPGLGAGLAPSPDALAQLRTELLSPDGVCGLEGFGPLLFSDMEHGIVDFWAMQHTAARSGLGPTGLPVSSVPYEILLSLMAGLSSVLTNAPVVALPPDTNNAADVEDAVGKLRACAKEVERICGMAATWRTGGDGSGDSGRHTSASVSMRQVASDLTSILNSVRTTVLPLVPTQTHAFLGREFETVQQGVKELGTATLAQPDTRHHAPAIIDLAHRALAATQAFLRTTAVAMACATARTKPREAMALILPSEALPLVLAIASELLFFLRADVGYLPFFQSVVPRAEVRHTPTGFVTLVGGMPLHMADVPTAARVAWATTSSANRLLDGDTLPSDLEWVQSMDGVLAAMHAPSVMHAMMGLEAELKTRLREETRVTPGPAAPASGRSGVPTRTPPIQTIINWVAGLQQWQDLCRDTHGMFMEDLWVCVRLRDLQEAHVAGADPAVLATLVQAQPLPRDAQLVTDWIRAGGGHEASAGMIRTRPPEAVCRTVETERMAVETCLPSEVASMETEHLPGALVAVLKSHGTLRLPRYSPLAVALNYTAGLDRVVVAPTDLALAAMGACNTVCSGDRNADACLITLDLVGAPPLTGQERASRVRMTPLCTTSMTVGGFVVKTFSLPRGDLCSAPPHTGPPLGIERFSATLMASVGVSVANAPRMHTGVVFRCSLPRVDYSVTIPSPGLVPLRAYITAPHGWLFIWSQGVRVTPEVMATITTTAMTQGDLSAVVHAASGKSFVGVVVCKTLAGPPSLRSMPRGDYPIWTVHVVAGAEEEGRLPPFVFSLPAPTSRPVVLQGRAGTVGTLEHVRSAPPRVAVLPGEPEDTKVDVAFVAPLFTAVRVILLADQEELRKLENDPTWRVPRALDPRQTPTRADDIREDLSLGQSTGDGSAFPRFCFCVAPTSLAP